MRYRSFTILFALMLVSFLMHSTVWSQDFTRLNVIDVPEVDLNVGGTGSIVADVDLDGDGKTEIYLVNDNWNDTADELIPRIYKLEKNESGVWEVVWKAVADIEAQNTWPPLVVGDLDKDGKEELIWCVINYTSDTNPNPYRILVYEEKGDGSDVMGVWSADKNDYVPNAAWTITEENNINIRPTKVLLKDIDNDQVTEIIMSDRGGQTSGYYFIVASVSDIPDNGGGGESWTLETSGLDHDLGTIYNKWDAAIIGNNCYFFCEGQISKLWWDGGNWQFKALSPMVGGSSFLTAQAVDLDQNETKEIIVPVYDWGNDAHKSVMLLQEDGDSLKHTELLSLSTYWPSGSRGAMGSAIGDVDGDDHLDLIFGSRASTPNAGIFRLAYKGGDITDPNNYALSVIDQEYATGGIWNVIALANVDDEAGLEVLYTSSTDAGVFPDLGTKSIIVLKYTATGIERQEILVITDYRLGQNYPNPFNPVTRINFAVPRSGPVKISVYDLDGRLVTTLVDADYSTGVHSVQWDGTSTVGKQVASGSYIYTLEAGKTKISRKMLLLK